DGKTRATAFCDISEALQATPGRPFIAVATSLAPYGPVTYAGTPRDSLTIVSGVRQGAQIKAMAGGSAVSVTAGRLTVEGFVLSGNGDVAAPAVACTGAGAASVALAVARSKIADAGGAGVAATGCTVTVDSVWVTGNAGPGISF